MNERMAGLMKTRRNGMNEELRPEYDPGQLHSRMKTRGSDHVLADRIAEQLASGLLAAPCQPLRVLKYVVGNRNGGLHTSSITTGHCVSSDNTS